MNTVTLNLKTEPRSWVDCRELQPLSLCSLDPLEIAAIKLVVGTEVHPLGDLFDVEATPGEPHLIIKNACRRLHYVGAKLNGGRIVVEGDVGDYLGCDLKHGEVLVNGNAGNFVASGQLDGLIHVRGNVGDYAGGAADTKMQGLKGGTLMISGLSGNFLGYKMRRGIIIAHENVGDHCANNMIAGTIILGSQCGNYLGLGMRRGSVIFLEKVEPDIPTFNPCGSFSLPILTILRHHVHLINHHIAMRLAKIQKVRRFCGDLGYDGQGEVLIAE